MALLLNLEPFEFSPNNDNIQQHCQVSVYDTNDEYYVIDIGWDDGQSCPVIITEDVCHRVYAQDMQNHLVTVRNILEKLNINYSNRVLRWCLIDANINNIIDTPVRDTVLCQVDILP
jgi:hypothetical protein